MMFDPKYVPETIDLVIVDDCLGEIMDLMKMTTRFYPMFGQKLGIGITPRYVPEKEMDERVKGDPTFTRDSLIYIHTNIENFKGLYEAKSLREVSPARIILSYDPVIFISEFLSDAEKLLGVHGSKLPSTPLVQVSFIPDTRECFHIQDIRGEVCYYIKQIVEMRRKNV